jgi:hypothetical protein
MQVIRRYAMTKIKEYQKEQIKEGFSGKERAYLREEIESGNRTGAVHYREVSSIDYG